MGTTVTAASGTCCSRPDCCVSGRRVDIGATAPIGRQYDGRVTVRVRFAPSPTGMFHVGGARSALHNWLYAKQHGGVFVLRIEDTDAARNRPEWTEGILSALDWIGIERGTYEGPYFQSHSAEQHREAAEKLHAAGQAFYCGLTRDLGPAPPNPAFIGFGGFWRERGLEGGPGRALRFRTPDTGTTVVVDLIR